MKNQNSIISIGRNLGKLTIIKEVPSHNRHRKVLCKCECGKEKIINFHSLTRKRSTKTCGSCVQQQPKTHGMTNHHLYNVYEKMLDRCYNKKSKNYQHYGERGIKICDEWKNNKVTFFEWALSTWKEGLTLDRIDNNGIYEPSNCKWSTHSEQNENQRRSLPKQLYNGQFRSLKEISRISGISYEHLRYKLKKGIL